MMTLIGTRLDATTYVDATEAVVEWASERQSRYVCAANVHMLMEAWDSPAFAWAVNNADLVTPDGMPLVWMMRLKGQRDQQRVYGPTLMLHILESAARVCIPVGFYGGTPGTLESLTRRMRARYENLKVAYSYSPPFGTVTPEEDGAIIGRINQSSVQILFVGLGCPKQETWMAEHRGKVNAVMVGVGAAFDFHAGLKSQAPSWIQSLGLEWLFRLMTEPRRLWQRYLFTNPRFVFLAIADIMGLLR